MAADYTAASASVRLTGNTDSFQESMNKAAKSAEFLRKKLKDKGAGGLEGAMDDLKSRFGGRSFFKDIFEFGAAGGAIAGIGFAINMVGTMAKDMAKATSDFRDGATDGYEYSRSLATSIPILGQMVTMWDSIGSIISHTSQDEIAALKEQLKTNQDIFSIRESLHKQRIEQFGTPEQKQKMASSDSLSANLKQIDAARATATATLEKIIDSAPSMNEGGVLNTDYIRRREDAQNEFNRVSMQLDAAAAKARELVDLKIREDELDKEQHLAERYDRERFDALADNAARAKKIIEADAEESNRKIFQDDKFWQDKNQQSRLDHLQEVEDETKMWLDERAAHEANQEIRLRHLSEVATANEKNKIAGIESLAQQYLNEAKTPRFAGALQAGSAEARSLSLKLSARKSDSSATMKDAIEWAKKQWQETKDLNDKLHKIIVGDVEGGFV